MNRPRSIGCARLDEGATAVEYAIIASLIAAVIAGVVGLVGVEVLGLFNDVIEAWP